MQNSVMGKTIYKKTGIPWLPEMPSHWEVRRLKYIAKIKNGMDCDKDNGGDIPVYGSGGIFARTKKPMYDKPSVLLGRKGTIDKPQLVTEPFWVVDTAFWTIVNPEISIPAFFYYLCCQIRFRYYSTNTVLPSMTQTDLYQVKLPVPPLAEQRAIARYLDDKTGKIDRFVGLKVRLVSSLKAYRQAIINRKLVGIGDEVKIKYCVTKVGAGVTPTGGAMVYKSSGVIFLRSQNVHNDGLRLGGVAHITEETHHNMKGSKVLKGDVLINLTGASVGRCFVFGSDDEANVNQHVCILRPAQDKILPLFLMFQLQSDKVQNEIAMVEGASREGLSNMALKNYFIYAPPIEEQRKIARYLTDKTGKIDSLIACTETKIRLMKAYKGALISGAVSGRG